MSQYPDGYYPNQGPQKHGQPHNPSPTTPAHHEDPQRSTHMVMEQYWQTHPVRVSNPRHPSPPYQMRPREETPSGSPQDHHDDFHSKPVSPPPSVEHDPVTNLLHVHPQDLAAAIPSSSVQTTDMQEVFGTAPARPTRKRTRLAVKEKHREVDAKRRKKLKECFVKLAELTASAADTESKQSQADVLKNTIRVIEEQDRALSALQKQSQTGRKRNNSRKQNSRGSGFRPTYPPPPPHADMSQVFAIARLIRPPETKNPSEELAGSDISAMWNQFYQGPCGATTCSQDGTILGCNDRMLEILHRKREDFIGSSVFAHTHPDSIEPSYQYITILMDAPMETPRSLVKKYWVPGSNTVVTAQLTAWRCASPNGHILMHALHLPSHAAAYTTKQQLVEWYPPKSSEVGDQDTAQQSSTTGDSVEKSVARSSTSDNAAEQSATESPRNPGPNDR